MRVEGFCVIFVEGGVQDLHNDGRPLAKFFVEIFRGLEYHSIAPSFTAQLFI